MYQVLVPLVGVFAGLACVLLISLFVAPYRQRNEARELVQQQDTPTGSEVNDAIRSLKTETPLVLKHNSGEERSYSFVQVLLAIADQLTIGIHARSFESAILEGLELGLNSGWYLPSADKGSTHLIGVLTQNSLIERHHEEDQRVTREVVSGATGIYLTPDAHLVKNVEVKYHLSPLGASVVQQLRKQPTSTKISPKPAIGLLVGRNDGKVINSHASGRITIHGKPEDVDAGGLIGAAGESSEVEGSSVDAVIEYKQD